MKASSFNIGNYLNAESAGEHVDQDLRIAGVRPEAIRGVIKPVMTFAGCDKGVVVNKTNRDALAAAYGDEMDAWAGKLVRIHIAQVLFQGRMVPSIVLAPTPEPQQPITPSGKKA